MTRYVTLTPEEQIAAGGNHMRWSDPWKEAIKQYARRKEMGIALVRSPEEIDTILRGGPLHFWAYRP